MGKLNDILTELASRTVANKRGTVVTLDSYTGTDYTFASDGYLNVSCGAAANARASVTLKDANGNSLGEMGGFGNNAYPSWGIFVKKGMKMRVSGIGDSGHVYFYPVGV